MLKKFKKFNDQLIATKNTYANEIIEQRKGARERALKEANRAK